MAAVLCAAGCCFVMSAESHEVLSTVQAHALRTLNGNLFGPTGSGCLRAFRCLSKLQLHLLTALTAERQKPESQVGNVPKPHIPLEERIYQVGVTISDPAIAEVYDRTLARIDRKLEAALRAEYAEDLNAFSQLGADEQRLRSPLKYLDIPFWVRGRAWLAVVLELHNGPPSRVLDIGCGAGAFPAICAALGHEVIGLDIPQTVGFTYHARTDFYAQMCNVMGVPRLEYRVQAYQDFPGLGEFDLVTALGVMFDFEKKRGSTIADREYWIENEWRWFLGELGRNSPAAKVYLELNWMNRGNGVEEPTRSLDFLEGCGATLTRERHAAYFKSIAGISHAMPEMDTRPLVNGSLQEINGPLSE